MQLAKVNLWSRRLHKWGSILIAIPILVVIATGILLQFKKDLAWIQPPTQKGVGGVPHISFESILQRAQNVPEMQVQTWADVDRLDVQPGKGIAKVQAKNSWELQVDLASGEVLQVAYRRSDWIESLHDGSFFHPMTQYAVFLPSALILLALWVTGMIIVLAPKLIPRPAVKVASTKGME